MFFLEFHFDLSSRYESGVFAEPFSIVGVASLYHNPELRAIFEGIGVWKSQKGLRDVLGSRAAGFALSWYSTGYEVRKYGLIVRREGDGLPPPIASGWTRPRYEPVVRVQDESIKGNHDEPKFLQETNFKLKMYRPHRLGAAGLACLLFTFFVIIIYYNRDNKNTSFEHFMDSQGFGVRFLFTSVGVIIRYYWGSIFQGNRAFLSPKYTIPFK